MGQFFIRRPIVAMVLSIVTVLVGLVSLSRLPNAQYPDIVPPLAQKLKKAAPDLIVMLAGYPAAHVEAFKAAGVDDFIHLNANCQALLSTLQKKMGIAQ